MESIRFKSCSKLSGMIYGISTLSIIPLRKEPSEQSEMVSQLLFGESYRVLKRKNQWLKILTQFDSYTGWIDQKLYSEISESTYKHFINNPPPVLASLIMSIECKGMHPLHILAGSNLPNYNSENRSLEIEGKIFQTRWVHGNITPKGTDHLPGIAALFLNTPYLWGGRSIFGCDCSGFVQLVYKILGLSLERDAIKQAEQGFVIESLGKSRQGDLAFFVNKESRICHVGLILSPAEIIHCSGYVRKDKIDGKGIYNSETREYTHRLLMIKRPEIK
jgi:hypothetical protein